MKRAFLAIAALCALASSLFLVHWTALAQTVALAPVPHMQFLNANGQPLAGGCVFTYAAGTTTPLASYTDSTGSVSNPNPIILDSGGFANIWLSGTGYKFEVYSNGGVNCSTGNLQWAVDNITTAGSGGGTGVASSLISASPNPAATGIIRMAASDTVCWRNAANSQDLCLVVDSQNRLIWQPGASFFVTQGLAAPVCPPAAEGIYGDPSGRLGLCNNGGAPDLVVGEATTDTLTNKTFNTGATGNVFEIAGNPVTATVSGGATLVDNGSTGAALTNAALTTPVVTGGTFASPALTTPSIGGATITNVPQMVWTAAVYLGFNMGNRSPSATPLSVMDTDQGGIIIAAFRLQAAQASFTCTTYPQYEIYDETAAAAIAGSTITMTANTAQYAVNVAQSVPGTHLLDIRMLNNASGTCSALGSVQASVHYIMQ